MLEKSKSSIKTKKSEINDLKDQKKKCKEKISKIELKAASDPKLIKMFAFKNEDSDKTQKGNLRINLN